MLWENYVQFLVRASNGSNSASGQIKTQILTMFIWVTFVQVFLNQIDK